MMDTTDTTNMKTSKESVPIHNASPIERQWDGIGGHFNDLSQIVCEFVDDSLSEFRTHDVDNRLILISVQEGTAGSPIRVRIEDGGYGISDIDSAMALGGISRAGTPLNEHGYGLKHALASANPGNDNWSISTRTPEDANDNRYKYIEAPFDVENGFSWEPRHGWVSRLSTTGTVIEFGCSDTMLATVRNGMKPTGDLFTATLETLKEDLGFVYAVPLKQGDLQIRICALDAAGTVQHEYHVTSIDPIWNPRISVQEGTVRYNLGGGEVSIHYTYGRIIPSTENQKYYRGNLYSSGAEIRINGRVISHSLFKEIWRNERHPTHNLFLARIDLITEHSDALPATRTSKNGFREGDLRLIALYSWICAMIKKPASVIALGTRETELFEHLAAMKRIHLPDETRISTEMYVYTSIDEKVRLDLFISDNGHNTVYEGKRGCTHPQDVYQLMMGWDGCIADGITPHTGILLASRHSSGVERLVKQLNTMRDADGQNYHFILETWEDEGIAYPEA